MNDVIELVYIKEDNFYIGVDIRDCNYLLSIGDVDFKMESLSTEYLKLTCEFYHPSPIDLLAKLLVGCIVNSMPHEIESIQHNKLGNFVYSMYNKTQDINKIKEVLAERYSECDSLELAQNVTYIIETLKGYWFNKYTELIEEISEDMKGV